MHKNTKWLLALELSARDEGRRRSMMREMVNFPELELLIHMFMVPVPGGSLSLYTSHNFIVETSLFSDLVANYQELFIIFNIIFLPNKSS